MKKSELKDIKTLVDEALEEMIHDKEMEGMPNYFKKVSEAAALLQFI